MRPLSERCVSTFVFKTQRCTRTRRKTSLNFEIHIFFANAFESTLPLPKVRTFNSRWRLLAWLAPLPSIYNANCILSSQNLLLFLTSQHWSSGRRRGFYLPKFLWWLEAKIEVFFQEGCSIQKSGPGSIQGRFNLPLIGDKLGRR